MSIQPTVLFVLIVSSVCSSSAEEPRDLERERCVDTLLKIWGPAPEQMKDELRYFLLTGHTASGAKFAAPIHFMMLNGIDYERKARTPFYRVMKYVVEDKNASRQFREYGITRLMNIYRSPGLHRNEIGTILQRIRKHEHDLARGIVGLDVLQIAEVDVEPANPWKEVEITFFRNEKGAAHPENQNETARLESVEGRITAAIQTLERIEIVEFVSRFVDPFTIAETAITRDQTVEEFTAEFLLQLENAEAREETISHLQGNLKQEPKWDLEGRLLWRGFPWVYRGEWYYAPSAPLRRLKIKKRMRRFPADFFKSNGNEEGNFEAMTTEEKIEGLRRTQLAAIKSLAAKNRNFISEFTCPVQHAMFAKSSDAGLQHVVDFFSSIYVAEESSKGRKLRTALEAQLAVAPDMLLDGRLAVFPKDGPRGSMFHRLLWRYYEGRWCLVLQ